MDQITNALVFTELLEAFTRLAEKNTLLEKQIAELRAERDEFAATVVNLAGQRDAAEAENAQLKALPLKDAVERVLEEVRDNGLIYWEPNTARGQDRKTAIVERIDALLSRLRAEQGGGGYCCIPVEIVDIFHKWFGRTGSSIRARWERIPDEDRAKIVKAMLAASPSVSEGGSR